MTAPRWRYATLLVVASACASPSPKTPADPSTPATLSPAARSQAEIRAEVLALLSRENTEPTPSEWQRLGPGTSLVLEQISADPAQPPARRARAVSALGHVPDARAETALQGIFQDPNADVALRSTAVLAFADRKGQPAAELLVPMLSEADAGLRAATARALGTVGGPTAQRALESQLEKEVEPGVREAIQKSLTKLQP